MWPADALHARLGEERRDGGRPAPPWPMAGGGLPDQQRHAPHPDGVVGQPVLHGLEPADGPAEGLAVLGVGDGAVEHPLGAAEGVGREQQTEQVDVRSASAGMRTPRAGSTATSAQCRLTSNPWGVPVTVHIDGSVEEQEVAGGRVLEHAGRRRTGAPSTVRAIPDAGSRRP